MNAQLLSDVFGDIRTSAGALFDAASQGELDALVLIGSDPIGDGLFSRQAKAALAKVDLVQVGAISGDMGNYAAVQLPAAAYSEVEGTFINMEGRVRVADSPLRSLGEERPMWKVMMRLVQAMGYDLPAVSLDEVREKVIEHAPLCAALADVWSGKSEKSVFIPSARNKGATLPNMASLNTAKTLDVVSRYSMYREGAWARASELLSEAGRIHALDDLIVHPATLEELGLEQGELTVLSNSGAESFVIGTREDVSPGVLFVAKRGVAGDLSGETSVDLHGGQS
jgi:NADH-quinone oxidoreductase subunit G